jgi:hypothetical protein
MLMTFAETNNLQKLPTHFTTLLTDLNAFLSSDLWPNLYLPLWVSYKQQMCNRCVWNLCFRPNAIRRFSEWPSRKGKILWVITYLISIEHTDLSPKSLVLSITRLTREGTRRYRDRNSTLQFGINQARQCEVPYCWLICFTIITDLSCKYSSVSINCIQL